MTTIVTTTATKDSLSPTSSINYTVSPPSTTSSSPILFYQQNQSSLSDNDLNSSTDSIDTLKSTTSTIKYNKSSSEELQSQTQSHNYSIPIQITAPSPQLPSTSVLEASQPQPKKKFNIPNYYVPPKNTHQEQLQPHISSSTNSTTSSSNSSLLSLNDFTQHKQQQQQQEKPKLLRKKSGELIKSSLKLSPHSFLQRSISSPNIIQNNGNNNRIDEILSPRKSVRFASRLINVKMFDGCESPASVSSLNSPCDSPPNEIKRKSLYSVNDFSDFNNNHQRSRFDNNIDESEEEVDDSYLDNSQYFNKPRNDYFDFDWNWHKSDDEEDLLSEREDETTEDEDEEDDEEESRSKEYRLISHDIPKLPSTKSNNKIWLTSAYIMKSTPQSTTTSSKSSASSSKQFLNGIFQVSNLGFEKKFSIKLTFNNWKSIINFDGSSRISYIRSVNSKIDEFKFMINLNDLLNCYTHNSKEDIQEKNITISLCIKYEVNGIEYWANNQGKNYNFNLIELLNQKPTQKSQSPNKFISRSQNSSPAPFKEICSKLINYQQSQQLNKNSIALKSLNSISMGKNFDDSTTSTSTNSSALPPRPTIMRKSFSSNDITTLNKHRYSNRQKQKESNTTTTTTTNDASSLQNSFSNLSYSDILNQYCFANNNTKISNITTTTTSNSSIDGLNKSNTSGVNNGHCSPEHIGSTASTLHYFSDSIHI
ncbi:uncharacterized protein KGF55_004333 [Candida pseudojiufengensis]|uniref:uncharacterized protein n=1 Tax=Candida pseudojiufengensis TaxID=497109 RepID=UPI002225106E|nr:uncharacterized protein KGF55_004333 [Candida pseudojiufengensis]KAI5960763.1 hypothetical protein KGF55_004333 [Candida pseudojiufengensis]